MPLVTEDAQAICGTIELLTSLPDNQSHRADLAKMLMYRRVRRQSVRAMFLRAVEDMARTHGKTLLVLDTVTDGDAARLYERSGWRRFGNIPGDTLFPHDGLCSTKIYYRDPDNRTD